MRNVMVAVALLVGTGSGAAWAQPAAKETAVKEPAVKESAKAKGAVAAAQAVLDKVDAAFNAGDAKAMMAFFDKSYFGEGPTVSAKFDYDGMLDHMTKMLAKGGRVTREGLTVRADDDGGAAWYIADYIFVPKVPPGALPVRRKMRESGVLVKKGKEWKVVMTHMSLVQLDEEMPVAPTTAAPMKK
jgi:ketosteroid isomerase-like protein